MLEQVCGHPLVHTFLGCRHVSTVGAVILRGSNLVVAAPVGAVHALRVCSPVGDHQVSLLLWRHLSVLAMAARCAQKVMPPKVAAKMSDTMTRKTVQRQFTSAIACSLSSIGEGDGKAEVGQNMKIGVVS